MSLEDLRSQIDAIDRSWIQLIRERIQVAKKIASIKKVKGLSLFDTERESRQLCAARHAAQEEALDPQVIEEILQTLLSYSKREMEKPE